MQRRNSLLNWLLLWIFMYPLMFQSWHNTRHHMEFDVSCCHHQACSLPDDGIHQDDDGEPCPVCDYQFSINDLPAGIEKESPRLVFSIFKVSSYSVPVTSPLYCTAFPRAPPMA